jgi:FHA domain-containing protein
MGIAGIWGLNEAEASDALQETMLVVLWPWRDFKPKTNNPAREFNAWVYGIARKKIWEQVRRKRAHEMISTEAPISDSTKFGDTIPSPADGPEAELEKEWRHALLKNAFGNAMKTLGTTEDPKKFYIFCEIVAGADVVSVAEKYVETRGNVDVIVFRLKANFCGEFAKELGQVGLLDDDELSELLRKIEDGSIKPSEIVKCLKESGIPTEWWDIAQREQLTLDGEADMETMLERLGYVAKALASIAKLPDSATLMRQMGDGKFDPTTLAQTLVVGRGDKEKIETVEAFLQIDEDMRLGRKHFRISRHEDFHVLEDLESKNGTFVNDLKEKKATRRLCNGDIIVAGNQCFVYFSGTQSEDLKHSSISATTAF